MQKHITINISVTTWSTGCVSVEQQVFEERCVLLKWVLQLKRPQRSRYAGHRGINWKKPEIVAHFTKIIHNLPESSLRFIRFWCLWEYSTEKMYYRIILDDQDDICISWQQFMIFFPQYAWLPSNAIVPIQKLPAFDNIRMWTKHLQFKVGFVLMQVNLTISCQCTLRQTKWWYLTLAWRGGQYFFWVLY